MTPSGPDQPTNRRPRSRGARRVHFLAAATAPLALAFTIPAAHPAARTSPPPAAALAAAHPAAAQAPGLTGLGATPTTVTLPTGDRIRVMPGPSGRQAITRQLAPRADGARPQLEVTSVGRQGRTPTLYALPADASALIAAGRVGKNLFNVGYLAAAGDTGTGKATLPVVIQYGGHLGVGDLAARAGRLPGASVRTVLPASNTAEISLDMPKAARFWAAITGGHTPTIQPAPRPGAPAPQPALAGGISKIWLAGHQSASQPARPAGVPTYTVTITLYGRSDPGPPNEWCFPGVTVCPQTLPVLTGVAGGGADNFYEVTGWSCVDANPCDTLQAQAQVPQGVYSTGAVFGWFSSDNRINQFDLVNPQFAVAGPTQIAFRLDAARPVKVSTPRPSQVAQIGLGDQRDLPDGTNSADLWWANYGTGDFWESSTPPVTIGTFNQQTTFDLLQPPVTMTATTSQQLQLSPFYPDYTGLAGNTEPGLPGMAIRFSGQQTLPLVDAGTGSPADFAGRDVRGKLVLMRLEPRFGCFASSDQLQNALDAGAAGVVIDPISFDFNTTGFDCPMPITPWWWNDFSLGLSLPPVKIPYVAVPHSQAVTLRHLISQGPVSITVTDNGEAHYHYYLKFEDNGQVHASLDHNLTSQQLTTVTANYQQDYLHPEAEIYNPDFAAFGSGDVFVAGTEDIVGAPFSRQEYMLAAPDLIQERDLSAGPVDAAGDVVVRHIFHIFDQRGGSETRNWFGQLETPGSPSAPDDVFQAQPGTQNVGSSLANSWNWCLFCRQGNSFIPLYDRVTGDAPGLIDGAYFFTADTMDQVHLFSGGQEIPPDLGGFFLTYDLPPAQARYRLTVNDANTQTAWGFTSAAPATDQRPEGTLCLGTFLGSSDDPCQPVPLVFLRYDAGLSLANTVTAPGAHQIQITAYHEAASAPAITGLKAWISTDGGTVWHPAAAVTAHGGGAYTVTYTLPKVSATSGTVSLKIQAQDADGNDVTQVIQNAFGISAK